MSPGMEPKPAKAMAKPVALSGVDLFKRHFAHAPPHRVRAPGRLELLGNHTDYNQGLVLAIAVEQHIQMFASPRNDGKVELVSSAFPKKQVFSLHQLKKDPAAPWTDYVKGVIQQLQKHGTVVKGFSAAIHSTIPMGAGMSSSAALEVATALVMRKMAPYTLTQTGCTVPPALDSSGIVPAPTAAEKLNIARLCQAAENEFVGVRSGLLDQVSCLFGKEAHAVELDCQSLTIEHVPMIGEIAIVVCDTGVPQQLTGGEYNELRTLCESAARALGVKSLRQVDPRFLTTNRSRLSEREYQCAYHIAGENQRVVFGARALRNDDFSQFGQFMFQSHESSRDYFKNSTPELDLLVELAREHPACLGSRLTGGGFGGATINLIARNQIEGFMKAMAEKYRARTGRETKPFLCKILDGAS
jgi:galactokinase